MYVPQLSPNFKGKVHGGKDSNDQSGRGFHERKHCDLRKRYGGKRIADGNH